jgi:small subunit ribosomal protein S1
MTEDSPAKEEKAPTAKAADLSSLTSMLQQRWKSGASPTSAKPDASSAGQIRSFRIARLDPGSKKIELELAKK